jgi:hypothetical protein
VDNHNAQQEVVEYQEMLDPQRRQGRLLPSLEEEEVHSARKADKEHDSLDEGEEGTPKDCLDEAADSSHRLHRDRASAQGAHEQGVLLVFCFGTA